MRGSSVVVVLVVACGGQGSSPDAMLPLPIDAAVAIDAPGVQNPGFKKPTMPLKANTEQSPDNWVELGPADLSCLGTPSGDQPTTVAVALSTVVRDFQNGQVVAGAAVSVFPDQQVGSPFSGSPYTSDANGGLTADLPIGTARFGFKVTQAAQLDTVIFNVIAAPDQATQTLPPLLRISNTTAQTLPALIGVSRTPGTGLVLGTIRDCQGREVSNFIATVSTTAGAANHVMGADTYYFSPTVGLPVRHTQQASGSKNGRFMVIELGPAESFIQVWGYPTPAALLADELTLIAELAVPVFPNTVTSGDHAPLRAP